MIHEPIRARRRATNVSLPEDLLGEAKRLNINVSRECTVGLAAAVKREDDRRWQEEHRARINAFAMWLDENGMPFENLRVY